METLYISVIINYTFIFVRLIEYNCIQYKYFVSRNLSKCFDPDNGHMIFQYLNLHNLKGFQVY